MNPNEYATMALRNMSDKQLIATLKHLGCIGLLETKPRAELERLYKASKFYIMD